MDKTASESTVIMTELVLPNDTNTFGNLMGGRLMYWMDIAAALAGAKHCNVPVVTASVDNISFTSPIKLGNVVHIEAKVSRTFNSSMEVHMKVWGEDALQQYKYKSNEAYYTFVSLDPNGKPRPVPGLVPETDDEKKLFDSGYRCMVKSSLKVEQTTMFQGNHLLARKAQPSERTECGGTR